MNYIVFDLEWNQSNTGREPEIEELPFEIIEIGAVKLNNEMNFISEFSQLIKPEVYREMHYITRKLIHIQMEELQCGKPFPLVMDEFLEWCGDDKIFCTWGPLDLVELQRNMRFYNMEPLCDKPFKFYDVQKLFSLAYEDGKKRRSLEYAIDFLKIEKDIPFHRAFSDAYYTGKILEKINEDGLFDVLTNLEIPLINILAEMEKTGFKINTAGMLEFAQALDGLSHELTERIYVQAGKEFNINSPKQLGELLFVTLGLPYKKKKNKSGYSTDAETLEELRAYSPIIDDILEYRQVTKLKNTYASALPLVSDENSRIHTDFKQAFTATGRLSSADPNLQNIPIRTKMGREMRRYFIAEEGYTLVDADYSQIELRLLAHISGDYNMIEAFKAGDDIHKKTAAAVFGVPEETVNEDMRKRAKAVNFGIVYGISGFSLAKDIGTTATGASQYIKNYLHNYPMVDAYLENVVKDAAEKGYTATPMGRRRYIPELTAQNGNLRAFGKRVAMNAPIQGAAADIMKLAMINVNNALQNSDLDARIVMQVHDELIIEVKEEQKHLCAEIVKREMENAVTLSLPLTVEVTTGKNWLEQN